MIDTIKAVIVPVALLGGFSLLVLWLRRRVSQGRWRPEELTADRRARQERVLRPDWEFYERHLQRPAPPALRDLYEDRSLVTALDLDYAEADHISAFEPLDEQGLVDTHAWLGFDAVAIAANGFGDAIYLRPGASEADTVYITYHDGGDTEVFAESVAAMVAILRHPNHTDSR